MSREIDALIAIHFFEAATIETTTSYGAKQHWAVKDPYSADLLPEYSTDIAAAWEVVEKFDPYYWLIKHQADYPKDRRYLCRINLRHKDIDAGAPTAPMAICLAALKAKNISIPETASPAFPGSD